MSGCQQWHLAVIGVVTRLVHVNVPSTPGQAGDGCPRPYNAALTAGGPGRNGVLAQSADSAVDTSLLCAYNSIK